MIEKLTLNYLATAVVDIPAVSMPIACSLCGNVLCDKTAHFRLAVYCPQLFNQLLDMPHLSGGWIILEREKCSLTGM